MRICRIVNSLPTDENPGAGLVAFYLGKYIPEPTLYIMRELKGCRSLPPHVKITTVDFRDATTPPSFHQAVFGEDKLNLFSGTLLQVRLVTRIILSHWKFFFTAMREMLRFRPHLVICHSLKRLIYGVIAKYLLRSKLVLSLHNTTETAALANLWLLRLLIRIPDRIVVVSAQIGRQLRPFVPDERIRLSSTGVDLERFVNRNNTRKKQLLTIGSFKWKKGYRHLLESASLVFKRYPAYRLVIVGEGEERQQITKTIDRLGLNAHVVLTGIVPREEIVRLLNESKLFVMASLHEGLPKVLLEAIACGTPAVVTDGCNAEGIIDTTGLSVPAGNPEALAEAIIAMVEDTELWEKCSRNGPQVAKYYDWKAVATRDYALYRELLDRKV
jgi:glycosyltransferase involved in cell wall biosynthesis